MTRQPHNRIFAVLLTLGGLALAAMPSPGAPGFSASFDKQTAKDGGGAKGRAYSIVDQKGRNGGKCLQYHKAAETAGPENAHYDLEVAVQPQTFYVASAWFKTTGDLRPAVRIATANWKTLAAGLCGDSPDWQEVRLLFRSGTNREVLFQIFGGSKTDDRESAAGTSYCDDVSVRPASAEEVRALRDYRVTVDAAAPLREINPLFFGVNTLFWIEDDAALRDGKLARLLHDLPCRLMRFPGGEVADNYHWQTRKLDNFHDFPASEGPDKLDCDKFMTLCRQVGAEPIFVVNLESGFVHHDVAAAVREAADWVRYANREKNYAVKYWELGNETYLSGTRYPLTAREYAETAVQFSRAMKAVDPTIQIGLVGPHTTGSSTALDKLTPDELKKIRAVSRSTRKNTLKKDAPGNPVRESSPGVPWWPTLVRLAGADMDFAVIHRYYPDTFGPDANVAKYIAPLREFFAKEIPGRKIPFALTEWNSGPDTPSSLASALIVAELIPDYLKAGVELACFWPMRYPSSGWNVRALIDDQTNEPRPSYQVMKLYTANMTGDAKLLPTAASSKSIYTAASLAPDSKRVTVFLINKALVKEPATVAIRLEGFAAKTATAVTLTGPDLKKNQAALASLPVTVQAGEISATLPPNSLTVVTCE